MFQRVATFHRAFGHLVATSPELPEQAVRDLRVRLLDEELQEFCAAYAVQDRVEMADALADMCYIIAGTVVCYGIVPAGQDEVHESPYDQFLPRTNPAIPELDALLCATFDDYVIAEYTDNLALLNSCLMNLLTGVFGVAMQLNIPINAVFAEVHRSNMAKLLPDGSVLRRHDGKIMKPDGWTPPDIAGVLGSRE